MSLPHFSESAGIYRFTWDSEKLEIMVTQIRQHNNGHMTGEITISTNASGYDSHLHRAQFNFSSSRSRVDIARLMQQRYPEADWVSCPQ